MMEQDAARPGRGWDGRGWEGGGGSWRTVAGEPKNCWGAGELGDTVTAACF